MKRSTSPEAYTKSIDGFGTWKIAHDTSRKRWIVKVKRIGRRWQPVDFYSTPDECATFVGGRATGELDWDAFPDRKNDLLLSNWTRMDGE
jgi:hypothetical protein